MRRPNQKRDTSSLLMGHHSIIEAINSDKQIDKVLVQRGMKGDLFNELFQLIKDHKIAYSYVPVEKLNRITRKNHQGVLAFISPITFKELDELVFSLFESGVTPKLLMLDRVSDVRNFGAIARSAECFGFHGIVVPFKGSAQISEDAVKTSSGALMNIDVCKVNDLVYSTKYLQQSGFQVVAISEKTKEPLSKIDFSTPTCLVMGSEEDGIYDELFETCDRKAAIPMSGKTASLNVSVSAGIAMYESLRD